MSVAILQEAVQVVSSAQDAASAIERQDWGVAERMLTEAQDRIGRLLREIGDRTQDALLRRE
jgi:hypothetical protein